MKINLRRLWHAMGERYNRFRTRLQMLYHNLKIGLANALPDPPLIGALLVIALGIYLFFKWFPLAYPNQPMTLGVLMPGFYANCITTILGTGFTVIFFDTLTRLRDRRLEKVRLIRDIACGDPGIARRAVIEITREDLHRNKLFRKSILRGQFFDNVQLNNVELLNADMSNSSFHYSSFSGTNFNNARLYLTTFWGCNLQYGDFRSADTTNTDFVHADLTKAKITTEQLQVAFRLHGAKLPNGKLYDGSFNLHGDIQDAKAYGFDIDNTQAMSKFYTMSDKDLHEHWLRKSKPAPK